ncbi:MAG TPA: hypothetical protein ENJ44_08185 [Oceanospirillales bacterium]|nr:hypothetical protein [Oceanospirillales bacterium]
MKRIAIILIYVFLLSGCIPGKTINQTNNAAEDPYAHKVTRTKNVIVDYLFPKTEDVWYEDGTKLVPIDGESCYTQASIGQAFKRAFLFSFTNKYAILVNGTKSFNTVNNRHPVFYIRANPVLSGVARLTIDKHYNKRYVWAVQMAGSNEANFYPPEDAIAFKWSKTQKDVYKITITDNLQNGEYAILIPDQTDKTYISYGFKVEK